MSIAPFVSYLVGRRSNNRRSSFSCYTYNRASAVDNVLCCNHFHGRNILTGLRLDVLYILAKIELCLIFPGVEVSRVPLSTNISRLPRLCGYYFLEFSFSSLATNEWNSNKPPSIFGLFEDTREYCNHDGDQSNQSVTFYRNFILRNLTIFRNIYERNFAFLFIFKSPKFQRLWYGQEYYYFLCYFTDARCERNDC